MNGYYVFYKWVNLVQLFNREAFEGLHTPKTEKDLGPHSTHASLLDGHQHPCSRGLHLSHSCLFRVTKCVGPLCSEMG